MTANLVPLLPGGVGTVEAGLIGALVGLGAAAPATVVAVLSFRLITFWLPTPLEALALARLRHLVASWGPGAAREP